MAFQVVVGLDDLNYGGHISDSYRSSYLCDHVSFSLKGVAYA